MTDISIKSAVVLLEAEGYHIRVDGTSIVGGEDPEPSGFGDVQLIHKPFRIEQKEDQWEVSSRPIGQITVTKSFDRLVEAFEFVLAKGHLKDPRTIITVKPSGLPVQILKAEAAGIEPVFRETYTRRVKK